MMTSLTSALRSRSLFRFCLSHESPDSHPQATPPTPPLVQKLHPLTLEQITHKGKKAVTRIHQQFLLGDKIQLCLKATNHQLLMLLSQAPTDRAKKSLVHLMGKDFWILRLHKALDQQDMPIEKLKETIHSCEHAAILLELTLLQEHYNRWPQRQDPRTYSLQNAISTLKMQHNLIEFLHAHGFMSKSYEIICAPYVLFTAAQSPRPLIFYVNFAPPPSSNPAHMSLTFIPNEQSWCISTCDYTKNPITQDILRQFYTDNTSSAQMESLQHTMPHINLHNTEPGGPTTLTPSQSTVELSPLLPGAQQTTSSHDTPPGMQQTQFNSNLPHPNTSNALTMLNNLLEDKKRKEDAQQLQHTRPNTTSPPSYLPYRV